MKTKMRLIALTITLAAVMTGVNAEAQRREYRSERLKIEKEPQADYKSGKRVYQKPDYSKGKSYQTRTQANRHHLWDNHEHSKSDQKKHQGKHYKYESRHEYHHPHYGHIYKNFRSKPVLIKHHHGDYYFHGGRYYSYRPGVGYIHVEMPRNLVFIDLPFRCERVWVGHRTYYRYNDVYFERCDAGYRLAPNVSIHLSAHF